VRRILVALSVTVACSGIAMPVAARAADTARPGGAITSPEGPAPANGGDQGWGNCGHNSSGGNPHTGDAARSGGNGGDQGQSCAPSDGGGGGGGPLPT
jgi:hypothetical protein